MVVKDVVYFREVVRVFERLMLCGDNMDVDVARKCLTKVRDRLGISLGEYANALLSNDTENVEVRKEVSQRCQNEAQSHLNVTQVQELRAELLRQIFIPAFLELDRVVRINREKYYRDGGFWATLEKYLALIVRWLASIFESIFGIISRNKGRNKAIRKMQDILDDLSYEGDESKQQNKNQDTGIHTVMRRAVALSKRLQEVESGAAEKAIREELCMISLFMQFLGLMIGVRKMRAALSAKGNDGKTVSEILTDALLLHGYIPYMQPESPDANMQKMQAHAADGALRELVAFTFIFDHAHYKDLYCDIIRARLARKYISPRATLSSPEKERMQSLIKFTKKSEEQDANKKMESFIKFAKEYVAEQEKQYSYQKERMLSFIKLVENDYQYKKNQKHNIELRYVETQAKHFVMLARWCSMNFEGESHYARRQIESWMDDKVYNLMHFIHEGMFSCPYLLDRIGIVEQQNNNIAERIEEKLKRIFGYDIKKIEKFMQRCVDFSNEGIWTKITYLSCGRKDLNLERICAKYKPHISQDLDNLASQTIGKERVGMPNQVGLMRQQKLGFALSAMIDECTGPIEEQILEAFPDIYTQILGKSKQSTLSM